MVEKTTDGSPIAFRYHTITVWTLSPFLKPEPFSLFEPNIIGVFGIVSKNKQNK